MRTRAAARVLLALALTGCAASGPAPASTPTTQAARAQVADVIAPSIVAIREAVQDAAKEVVTVTVPPRVDACADLAVATIIRWEIGSPQLYTRKYEGVIWPEGSSGPTWAIGYDGGHQTRRTILADWAMHPHATDLAETSGVTGTRAKAALPRWASIRTPYPMAKHVFLVSTLPQYTAAARRAVGPAFDLLPCGAQASLVDVGYNRGWSLLGPKRVEMRELIACARALATTCMADAYRRMKRHWPTVRGLRDRRDDEARLALLPT